MSGRTFLRAIGCILNITNRIECNGDGCSEAKFFRAEFCGYSDEDVREEESRAMLQMINGPAHKLLSCRNVLKRLRP